MLAVFFLGSLCGSETEPANCAAIRELKNQIENPTNWVDAPEAIKLDLDLALMEAHFPCKSS